MDDGIITTLTNQTYFKAKKELVSLGTLDFSYSYRTKGGVIRILKGVLIVMKIIKWNGLYFLQGSTTMRNFIVSSLNLDTMILWYMRLGYMNKKKITLLSK